MLALYSCSSHKHLHTPQPEASKILSVPVAAAESRGLPATLPMTLLLRRSQNKQRGSWGTGELQKAVALVLEAHKSGLHLGFGLANIISLYPAGLQSSLVQRGSAAPHLQRSWQGLPRGKDLGQTIVEPAERAGPCRDC